ncbi:hypothetical protein MLD38_017869 [Melastoma candidum]|uniref:Uncharacterized protein n=1 Tax=Melastoma candidum TaxID=119954 RepID=A0ACB9QS34_9MYRT|nr:hypothetical protein MLD38_017869 [Melastoma candidum]
MITAISWEVSPILFQPPIFRPNCGPISSRRRPFRDRRRSIKSDGGGGDGDASPDDRPVETSPLIRVAVSGATELLKFFSPPSAETKRLGDAEDFEISASCVDDVVRILESDYEKDYFLTGVFTSDIYTEDCIFEDPTIKFRGKALYERNLKLLVPFFISPSVELLSIEKGEIAGKSFILAKWKLRTYLRFPWRPLITIDGSTAYDLNDEFKVIRHAESWNVSAFEAIGQIFTPSFGKSDG